MKKLQRAKLSQYQEMMMEPKSTDPMMSSHQHGKDKANSFKQQQYPVINYQQCYQTPTLSILSGKELPGSGGQKSCLSPTTYQKITRQDRIVFYEANSPLEDTIKYEANLPQLPDTTEIDLLKMKGGKLIESHVVMPSSVVTTTPPPISILGTTSPGTGVNTIRTQYVKKKDIGHGLKSTLQQSEVKNLSVIAEEAECLHSSSRNSVIDSSVKSSSSTSATSSLSVNCKIDIDEQVSEVADNSAVVTASVVVGGGNDNEADRQIEEVSAKPELSIEGETNELVPEFLDEEKVVINEEIVYDKDSLIYI